MRKLLVFICFLSFQLAFSQSYTVHVNLSQLGNSTFGNSYIDTAKTFFSSFEDSYKNSYIAGYYNKDSSSFIKKYNEFGEEIFSLDFHERVFFSKTQLVKNDRNQFILTGQTYIPSSNNVILRVICLDFTLTKLWDVEVPPSIGTRYLCCDVKFDAENNVYLSGELEANQSRRSFIVKCSSSGSVIFQKIINPSSPYDLTYLGNNGIINIDQSSILVVVRHPFAATGFRMALYKLDKVTGNTIKSVLFDATWSGRYLSFNAKIINNNIYLGIQGYWGGSGIQVYYFRKLNLEFDSLWTKVYQANTGYFDFDYNKNICISSPNFGTKCIDTNGNQIWSNQNLKGFLKFSNINYSLFNEFTLSDPMYTKVDSYGNIILTSELPNPYFYYSSYITPLPSNGYRVVGLSSNPYQIFKSEYSETGSLKSVLKSGYYDDKATDFKFYNNNLYISYNSNIKENFTNAIIAKSSTNGSIQWNKDVFKNNKGTASINNIVCENTSIYGTGEVSDTLTNRINTELVKLDDNGNLIFNYSFKSKFSNNSSGKIVNRSNNAIYIAGQYKDSLEHSKIFLAKNIDNENIWLLKFNEGVTNDSVVSLSFDSLGNIFISYNLFTNSVSSSFKLCKVSTNGTIQYNKEVSNGEGIILAKTQTDFQGNIFSLASVKSQGSYDLVTQKRDSLGNSVWIDTYDNPQNTNDLGSDLIMDKYGDILISSTIINSNMSKNGFLMKLSNNGERLWNKIYNSGISFTAKNLNADNLNFYYLWGFLKDATNLVKQTVLQYDSIGSLKNMVQFNSKDTTALLFTNDFMIAMLSDVQLYNKKLFCVSNVSRVNRGSEIKVNYFTSNVTVTTVDDTKTLNKFNLQQNYPNPFNPTTSINFQIPKNSFVNLKIYDVNGREQLVLINEMLQAGMHKINFDGNNLSSGVYYYKLSAGEFTETKKMVLVK